MMLGSFFSSFRPRSMPNYCEDSNDDEYYDSDVTWSMQHATNQNVESNSNSNHEVYQQRDPLGYRYMSEGGEKRKKKKKHNREHGDTMKKSGKKSQKFGVGSSSAKKDPGYGLGLSRGFSLWRTLKDVRHCITKVSDPMTKAQRRSLRRKLSYYVDDLERIVVGVNPRASDVKHEEVVSGDEEMREEVNALIEDALDEAALQGKIVQSDYFETRMSYIEQQYATLKKQLEEVASMKEVSNGNCSSSKDEIPDSQACSSTSREKVEATVNNDLDKQDASSSFCKQPRGRPYLNNAKKKKVEVVEEPEVTEDAHVQEVGQKKKRNSQSSSLHSSLCDLQASVIERISNPGSAESHSDDDEHLKNPNVSSQKDLVNSDKEKLPDLSAWTDLGKKAGQSVKEKVQENPEPVKIERPPSTTEPFRGWGIVTPKRPVGRPRKNTPAILKRINLKY